MKNGARELLGEVACLLLELSMVFTWSISLCLVHVGLNCGVKDMVEEASQLLPHATCSVLPLGIGRCFFFQSFVCLSPSRNLKIAEKCWHISPHQAIFSHDPVVQAMLKHTCLTLDPPEVMGILFPSSSDH